MSTEFLSVILPSYGQMLGALGNCIGKARDFCVERNLDETAIVSAKLAPDMLDFAWQVKLAAAHALHGLQGVQDGRYVPDATKPPTTLAALADLVEAARTEIAGLDREALAAAAGGDVLHVPRKVSFAATDFLAGFSIPNFYFHWVTAYDILRANGVPVGKADYLGALPTRPQEAPVIPADAAP